MNNLCRFENMSKELCPITNEEINEIQDFVCDILEDFLNACSKEEIILKRKDLRSLDSFYKKRNGDFWCLREDNKIIATIAVHEILYNEKKVGFLRRLYIDKYYRNRGLGGKMLKFIEHYSEEKKWNYLMFGVDESMERNKTFYFRNGYEEFTKDIPQEILDDNDRWYLRKRI